MTSGTAYSERFAAYFDRSVAQSAAKSIGDGAEIEFRIGTGKDITETFTFTKQGGRNRVELRPAADPQVVFIVPPQAAEEILANAADDIGSIGVGIAKLIVANDSSRRVSLQLKAGFFTLLGKGYLGVLTAGGTAFASFLAQHGLNGMGAIKSALKKMTTKE